MKVHDVINVDLDGCVYPWHEVMALWCWELRGASTDTVTLWDWDYHNELPLPAPTRWGFEGQWGMTEDELNAAARLGIERGFVWHQGKPIPGSVASLWRLSSEGYYIRLVTQRLVHKNNHAEVQQATAKWLDNWNVPYHEIIYMGKGSTKGEFHADFAIDDNVNNVVDMRAEGIDAYLLERPWNLKEKYVGPTVFGWEEFEVLIGGGEQLPLEAWDEDQVESVSEGSSGSS